MNENKFTSVLEGPFLEYVYNLLKANTLRDRKTMSLVLIRLDETDVHSFIKKIQETIRKKDVVFLTNQPNEIGILLTQSSSKEAKGFLYRLHDILIHSNFDKLTSVFGAAIIEIYHPELALNQALVACRKEIAEFSDTNKMDIVFVKSGYKRQILSVKVSILEGDKLFREFLSTVIKQIEVAGIELEVREFEDGLSLSKSSWTNSWHPHLVVMNDVLPKMNGLDVLHELRMMPNEEKFIILMMTRRKSEEDMIYAYESGTDGYLVKPFNLRLFEAQVKSLLGRLWS